MSVQDREAVFRVQHQVRRRARQDPEPLPVVGKVEPPLVAIRSAVALEQLRRVEHDQGRAVELGLQEVDRLAEHAHPTKIARLAPGFQRVHHRRVAWNQGGHLHPLRGQGAGQGARHIGQAPCLDQGIDF